MIIDVIENFNYLILIFNYYVILLLKKKNIFVINNTLVHLFVKMYSISNTTHQYWFHRHIFLPLSSYQHHVSPTSCEL